jgi:uncharacterized protein with HEPN domain
MTQNRLVDYLTYLAEAAAQARIYVEGMSKDEFLADKRTQQAVIMNLVIIGEVATKLLQSYGDFLERYPQVPWKSMKGMRNRPRLFSPSISALSGRLSRQRYRRCCCNCRPSLSMRSANSSRMATAHHRRGQAPVR